MSEIPLKHGPAAGRQLPMLDRRGWYSGLISQNVVID